MRNRWRRSTVLLSYIIPYIPEPCRACVMGTWQLIWMHIVLYMSIYDYYEGGRNLNTYILWPVSHKYRVYRGRAMVRHKWFDSIGVIPRPHKNRYETALGLCFTEWVRRLIQPLPHPYPLTLKAGNTFATPWMLREKIKIKIKCKWTIKNLFVKKWDNNVQ